MQVYYFYFAFFFQNSVVSESNPNSASEADSVFGSAISSSGGLPAERAFTRFHSRGHRRLPSRRQRRQQQKRRRRRPQRIDDQIEKQLSFEGIENGVGGLSGRHEDESEKQSRFEILQNLVDEFLRFDRQRTNKYLERNGLD